MKQHQTSNLSTLLWGLKPIAMLPEQPFQICASFHLVSSFLTKPDHLHLLDIWGGPLGETWECVGTLSGRNKLLCKAKLIILTVRTFFASLFSSRFGIYSPLDDDTCILFLYEKCQMLVNLCSIRLLPFRVSTS